MSVRSHVNRFLREDGIEGRGELALLGGEVTVKTIVSGFCGYPRVCAVVVSEKLQVEKCYL